jgi:hypothetical protein
MKNFLKRVLVGDKAKVYTIKYGVAKGLKIFLDPKDRSLRLFALDETELQTYIRKFAPHSEVFVDLGSSDGYYPLIYRKLNPAGEIFSFEVQEIQAVEQPKNFEMNGFDTGKLHVIQKYASDRVDDKNVTVDSMVAITGKKVFLKVDIEGAELIALKGAKNLLVNNVCSVIVETHAKELEDQCEAFLKQLGFSTEIVNPAWYRSLVPEARSLPHNRWLIAESKAAR